MRTDFACLESLNHAVDHFPFAAKLAYADWLAQTYYYVRHSTRLLAAAAARFGHDPVSDALHVRFGKHMGEESRHERLCIHDIKALGLSIEELPEHAATRMFYEPQYYKIEHVHPVALLGYVLPLEWMAVSRGQQHDAIIRATYPEKCGSFVRVHANEDPEHLEKAFASIDSLPLDLQAIVRGNVEQSTFAYAAMLAEIKRKSA